MSIDSCYEGAIATLTAQNKIIPLSKELHAFKTNSQRVLFVYDVLEKLETFPTLIKVAKNEDVSTYYRNLGNQCYQKADNYRAWQYYNLSILHAPIESEAYCLGFSNRSAVFSSLKKFTECLEDINKVFSLKFPTSIEDKLKQRQEICKKLIESTCFEDKDTPKFQEIYNMQGPKDETYLCASKKVKVVFTKEMGRHVIANQDINVGELIAQEEPFLTLLLKSQFLFSCSYCMSRNLNLIPCEKCCFALYCNENCRERAWKDYHEVECPLMPTLVNMEFTKLELLALRTVIKARTSHSNWHQLFKTIEQVEANVNTELYGLVQVDGEWVYDSKYYASVHSLESNIDKRSISDIFQKSVTAAVLLYLLKSFTKFMDCDEEDKVEVLKCVAGILLHHNMTSPTNMHGIDANIADPTGHFVNECGLGSACYAFMSLLNHSCAPNTVRVHKLGTGCMRLYALRPIKAGSQLFDNYGAHHALAPRTSRQNDLKFQYKFVCQCEACINDWPTYFALKSSMSIPNEIAKEKQKVLSEWTIKKLQLADEPTALAKYQPLCHLLEQLEPYGPCKEIADCQESLKQCLQIFSGVLPYGYSQVVEWKAIPPAVKKNSKKKNKKNKK